LFEFAVDETSTSVVDCCVAEVATVAAGASWRRLDLGVGGGGDGAGVPERKNDTSLDKKVTGNPLPQRADRIII
jgi:hypothetical protein